MLHSTVSAILEAERTRTRARIKWIAASTACHVAWASLMFLLLAAVRPATAFSPEYIGIASFWYVGHRVIARKLKPLAPSATGAATGTIMGEAF